MTTKKAETIAKDTYFDFELVKLEDLKPCLENTKKHDQEQIDKVAASIQLFGWTQPIVIDENGEIIIGHCRFEAAQKLGNKFVPCRRIKGLSAEQITALRIADNKLNESPWFMDRVDKALAGLSDELIDITGFNKLEAELQDIEIKTALAEFAQGRPEREMEKKDRKTAKVTIEGSIDILTESVIQDLKKYHALGLNVKVIYEGEKN